MLERKNKGELNYEIKKKVLGLGAVALLAVGLAACGNEMTRMKQAEILQNPLVNQ